METLGITNFTGQIRVTRTVDGTQKYLMPFDNELDGQNKFDELTFRGNEHAGCYKWDLEVNHPESGVLIRRTMFTNKNRTV